MGLTKEEKIEIEYRVLSGAVENKVKDIKWDLDKANERFEFFNLKYMRDGMLADDELIRFKTVIENIHTLRTQLKLFERVVTLTFKKPKTIGEVFPLAVCEKTFNGETKKYVKLSVEAENFQVLAREEFLVYLPADKTEAEINDDIFNELDNWSLEYYNYDYDSVDGLQEDEVLGASTYKINYNNKEYYFDDSYKECR